MQNKIKQLKNYAVYEDIEGFLINKDIRSSSGNSNYMMPSSTRRVSNTRKNYEGDIKQFFSVIKGKDVKSLVPDDLVVSKSELSNYVKYLQEKGLVNNSINRKMTSLKMLYTYLEHDYKDYIDLSVFNTFERLKTVTKNWDKTTQTEAERIAQDMYINERQKPLMKKLFVKFAIRTSFRVSAILRVRWKDIQLDESTGHYIVTVIDKGSQVVSTGINQVFYEELLQLKEEDDSETELVFQGLSEQSLRHSLKRSKKRLGIPPERELVLHSFKGVGIDYVYENSGHDLLAAKEQGNHKNTLTTERYMSRKINIANSAGVTMDEKIDLNPLYEATQEDFISFFENADLVTLKKFIKHVNER